MRGVTRALALALTVVALNAAAADLKPGDKAPDFALQGSDGKPYKLSDFVGKRGVVLAWFPKAGTPGCTAELGSLRDTSADLASYDAAVFMVSYDSPEANAQFAKDQNAPLVLLSDPKGTVAAAYGVGMPGLPMAKRWTFYIGKDGVIRYVDKGVQTASAGKDIAKKLGELGFDRR
jgi:peroxiredoxin Q/BCP